MKAVLEFNYPEDTHKLKCALHGEEMHNTLLKIKARINETFKHDDDPTVVLLFVRDFVETALKNCEGD
jgi:hypothetical protein